MPARQLAPALLLVLALGGGATPAFASAGRDADGRTTHTVYAGQTLGRIAKRYNVSVEALRHANGLRYGARIRPGQKLLIPDEQGEGTATALRGSARDRWQDYVERPRRRGFVTLESPTKRWRGYVLSHRGKVLPRAREAVEKMLASWRTGTGHEID